VFINSKVLRIYDKKDEEVLASRQEDIYNDYNSNCIGNKDRDREGSKEVHTNGLTLADLLRSKDQPTIKTFFKGAY
jgi:hypothetical protein